MEELALISNLPAGCIGGGEAAHGCFTESGAGLGMLATMRGTVGRIYGWALASIRERGFWMTLVVAFSAAMDKFFDWRYGTDTAQMVSARDLKTDSDNLSRAVRYQPTKARPFRKMLRQLRLPEDSVFVDYGSGKGRVLLMAAREPFKRVVGVEFSPELCGVARSNIGLYSRKVKRLAPIEIIESDAALHPLRHDENVFFFFNPFDEVVLARVVERIESSLASHPRSAKLIYCTPCHPEVIERSRYFTRSESHWFGGMEFRVYSNASGVSGKPGGHAP